MIKKYENTSNFFTFMTWNTFDFFQDEFQRKLGSIIARFFHSYKWDLTVLFFTMKNDIEDFLM